MVDSICVTRKLCYQYCVKSYKSIVCSVSIIHFQNIVHWEDAFEMQEPHLRYKRTSLKNYEGKGREEWRVWGLVVHCFFLYITFSIAYEGKVQ